MPAYLEIASQVGLELSAGQEIQSASLKIAIGLASELTTAQIVYSEVLIGSAISIQFEANSIKQASVNIVTDLALELTATATLAGDLQIGILSSCKLNASLAPVANLKIGMLQTCVLQGQILKNLQILIGTDIGLVLDARCEAECGSCCVPCYSSLEGGY